MPGRVASAGARTVEQEHVGRAGVASELEDVQQVVELPVSVAAHVDHDALA